MANDTTIRTRYPTGKTLYTQIESGSGVWNGTAYETFATADWGLYATSTPETPASSGRYVCQFPTSSAAGNYAWVVYLQSGGTPATTDTPIASGSSYWDGTTFGGTSAVTGDVSGKVLGSGSGSISGVGVQVANGGGAIVVHQGTAQAGGASTITLDTGASSTDNVYQGCQVYLVSGTGAGQTGVVAFNGYKGSTRVATMTIPWAVIPDATTTFQVLPQGPVVLGQLGGGTRTVTQDWNGPGSLTVEDATTGLPIANAALTAYLQTAYAADPSQAQSYGSGTTDASGKWTLTLAPAAYTITVTLSGASSPATTFNLTVN